ncbi:MAG TPA: nitrite/sulfite reductase [Phycisphaerae bacterium]|nr:nitrite/sulfite reductase [Phycisphaerae bacterium]
MAAEHGFEEIDGKKLNKVEAIKLRKDGVEIWKDIFAYGAADAPALPEDKAAAFMQAGGREEDLKAAARQAAIPEEDFVRMRWYGIYQQLPNNGYFMMRIRIPNGILTPAQFREVAAISRQHCRGFGDITTRQCIQLHWNTITAFTDILPRLEKVGLGTKFACGDTPRNVVGCPMAGLLPAEIIDASPAVRAVNEMYMQGNREFSNFPRKFKTALAGCHLHCHQPQINDIGVFGVMRKNPQTGAEERGYGVCVGGGLSTTPHIGPSLRVFIREEQVPAVCRGIAHIFRDHGYREKRTRARMKFLVADWGWEKFRTVLEEKIGFALEHDDTIIGPVHAPHTDHMGSGPQKQPGLNYVGIPIERGRVTSDQMEIVANLTEKYAAKGKGQIRLSNKQNLILANIPTENLEGLVKELTDAGLPPHAPLWRTSLISCTGTQFCNLAIVETKQRAHRILKFLEEECEIDSPIFLSVTGCPNSCAQYQIADIGLMGVVCNYKGVRQTEAYQIMLGGALGADPKFATLTMKKVPADFVHKAIKQLVDAYKANRLDGDETFRQFLSRHTPEQLTGWLMIPEMADVK